MSARSENRSGDGANMGWSVQLEINGEIPSVEPHTNSGSRVTKITNKAVLFISYNLRKYLVDMLRNINGQPANLAIDTINATGEEIAVIYTEDSHESLPGEGPRDALHKIVTLRRWIKQYPNSTIRVI